MASQGRCNNDLVSSQSHHRGRTSRADAPRSWGRGDLEMRAVWSDDIRNPPKREGHRTGARSNRRCALSTSPLKGRKKEEGGAATTRTEKHSPGAVNAGRRKFCQIQIIGSAVHHRGGGNR